MRFRTGGELGVTSMEHRGLSAIKNKRVWANISLAEK